MSALAWKQHLEGCKVCQKAVEGTAGTGHPPTVERQCCRQGGPLYRAALFMAQAAINKEMAAQERERQERQEAQWWGIQRGEETG